MQVYTKQDLNNLNSSQKQTVLDAEKTFITFGEGVVQTAFKLSDIVIAIKGLVDKKAAVAKVKEEKKAPAKRSTRKKKK